MSIFSLHSLRIQGISAAVPAQIEDNKNLHLIPSNEMEMFIEQTGIRYRRIAERGVTASDLCIKAAKPLIETLNWVPEEIDVLIFISQTPDYLIPNTASVIHQQMGLSKKCIAMDINLGCSGYVYGLSVIGALLQNINFSKGLLLVGDCSSSVISKNDKSTFPLFSDAGSATAIMHDPDANKWHFNMQTDGNGYEDIMIRGGGMRHPFDHDSLTERQLEPGINRNDLQMKINGINIFSFALREVAPNVDALLDFAGIPRSGIDFFVLHQANKLMLECIRRKLKGDKDKFPYSLYHFGNTSSASIPITIVTEMAEKISGRRANLLLSGFGVGLSWGSVCMSTDTPLILPLIEV